MHVVIPSCTVHPLAHTQVHVPEKHKHKPTPVRACTPVTVYNATQIHKTTLLSETKRHTDVHRDNRGKQTEPHAPPHDHTRCTTYTHDTHHPNTQTSSEKRKTHQATAGVVSPQWGGAQACTSRPPEYNHPPLTPYMSAHTRVYTRIHTHTHTYTHARTHSPGEGHEIPQAHTLPTEQDTALKSTSGVPRTGPHGHLWPHPEPQSLEKMTPMGSSGRYGRLTPVNKHTCQTRQCNSNTAICFGQPVRHSNGGTPLKVAKQSDSQAQ
jgi:hypothetical protein